MVGRAVSDDPGVVAHRSGSGLDGVSVRRATVADDAAMLQTMNAAFGRNRSPEWFGWKHRAGPWGPSHGWVAEDGDGEMIGVRLYLPWRLAFGGAEWEILRAVDAAVVPGWRRRGVFDRLLDADVEAGAPGDRPLVYSTPVAASCEAHRKSGWTILAPVRQVLSPIGPWSARTAAVVFDATLDPPSPVGAIGDRLSTAWTDDGLRWRTDASSGREYHTAQLAGSDVPGGLVARRATVRGLPVLVVVHQYGDPAALAVLIRSVARAWRTRLVLGTAEDLRSTLRREVAASTVTVMPGSAQLPVDPRSLRSWRFTLADLEGVI